MNTVKKLLSLVLTMLMLLSVCMPVAQAQSMDVPIPTQNITVLTATYGGIYTGDKLFDGDKTANGRWCCAMASAPQPYVVFDVQQPTEVVRMIMTSHAADEAPREYHLQTLKSENAYFALIGTTEKENYLKDTTNWETLITVHNEEPQRDIVESKVTPNGERRIYRLLATKGQNSINAWVNISELELFQPRILTENEAKISYETNGGVGEQNPSIQQKGERYVLPQCTIQPPKDMMFECWQTKDGLKRYAVGDSFVVENNVVLMPSWTKVPVGAQINPQDFTVLLADSYSNMAHQIFDGNKNYSNRWYSSNCKSASGAYVVFSIPNPLALSLMRLTTGNVNEAPQSYSLQILKDEKAYESAQNPSQYLADPNHWNDLVTVQNMNPVEDPCEATIVTKTPAKYYRLHITSGGTNADRWANVSELELYEYAIQLKDPVSVSFLANGGNGLMPTAKMERHSVYALPQPEFTPQPSFVFDGWRVDEESFLKQPGEEITVSQDTMLTAVWTDKLTLQFDAGEGTGQTVVYEYDERQTVRPLPQCLFKAPQGTAFIGWRIAGQEKRALPGDSIDYMQKTGQVCVWQAVYAPVDSISRNAFSVSYALNGGAGVMEEEFSSNRDVFTVPECTLTPPENMEFDYWTLDGFPLYPGQTFTVLKNISLVPTWQERKEFPKTFAGYSVHVPQNMKAPDGATEVKDLKATLNAIPIGEEKVLTDGIYAVNHNLILTEPLKMRGNVQLILTDRYALQAKAGIEVTNGSLTIWACSTMDNLNVGKLSIGGFGLSGIQSYINILGGDITAKSSTQRANSCIALYTDQSLRIMDAKCTAEALGQFENNRAISAQEITFTNSEIYANAIGDKSIGILADTIQAEQYWTLPLSIENCRIYASGEAYGIYLPKNRAGMSVLFKNAYVETQSKQEGIYAKGKLDVQHSTIFADNSTCDTLCLPQYQSEWYGIVFHGKNGEIYAPESQKDTQYLIEHDFTISKNYVLQFNHPGGTKLTSNHTLINEGVIENMYGFVQFGDFQNLGVFAQYGKFSGTENGIFVTGKTEIQFDTQGGEALETVQQYVTQQISLPLPKKAGCTFLGWEYNGQNYDASILFDVPENSVKFTAKWQQNLQLQISAPLLAYAGQKLADIQFDGVYMDVPGTFTWKQPQTDLLAGTHEYEASFTPNDLTWYTVVDSVQIPVTMKEFVMVSFAGGGGSMHPVVLEKGSSFVLPQCKLIAPQGKRFEKWNLGNVGKKITLESNVILVAQWQEGSTSLHHYQSTAPEAKTPFAWNMQSDGRLTLYTKGTIKEAASSFKAYRNQISYLALQEGIQEIDGQDLTSYSHLKYIRLPLSATTITHVESLTSGTTVLLFKGSAAEEALAEQTQVKKVYLGELTGDDTIDLADYNLLVQAVTTDTPLTEEQKLLADCDGDGAIDAFDAALFDQAIHKA